RSSTIAFQCPARSAKRREQFSRKTSTCKQTFPGLRPDVFWRTRRKSPPSSPLDKPARESTETSQQSFSRYRCSANPKTDVLPFATHLLRIATLFDAWRVLSRPIRHEPVSIKQR